MTAAATRTKKAPARSKPAAKQQQAARSNGYTADTIKVLEGLEPVRTRPGMYIGGVDSAGLSHLLWELIDNAVDEAAEGHGKQVTVTLHDDGSYEVADRGRGIPTGKHKGSNRSALEVVFTELHAGGKFGTEQYGSAGGLHGVGASVVNALADRLTVEVDRDGYTHTLVFEQRVPGQYQQKTGKFKPTSTLTKQKLRRAGATGTRVRFWPDYELFDTTARIDPAAVEQRLRQVSWLLPKVTFTLVDRTGEQESVTEYRSAGGLSDAVDHLVAASGGGQPVTPTVTFQGEYAYGERIADTDTGGTAHTDRVCRVEVAMRWVDKAEPEPVVSFVNTIATTDGGTHTDGLVASVSSEVRAAIKAAGMKKLAKTKGETAQQADALAGLRAVLRVTLPEPQFLGQTKQRLSTTAAAEAVKEVLRPGLRQYLAGKDKQAKARDVRALLNHIADAMLDRLAAADAARNRRKLKSLSVAELPAKLADCRQHPDGELLLVEGDSAAGPAKRARDAQWQAVLPLRGKIVNAAKISARAVAGNAEAAALITAIGAGAGQNFDADSARYQRIVLLADADVDGAHIRCLLLALLWTHMRPMLEQHRVFAANPPTHAVTSPKGGKRYLYGEADLQAYLKQLGSTPHRVTRFKGLGEMDDDELRHTTLDPTTRLLRRVTVEDAEAAQRTLDRTMGTDVAERREFIAQHSADYLRHLDV